MRSSRQPSPREKWQSRSSKEWDSRFSDRSHTSRYRPRDRSRSRERRHRSRSWSPRERTDRWRPPPRRRSRSRHRSPPRRDERRRSRSPRWQRSPPRPRSPPRRYERRRSCSPRRQRSPPRRRQRSPPPEPPRRKPASRSVSPVVTAESTATVVDGGPTLDSVMRAHPGLSVTDALEVLARKSGSAADKAVEHHGREGKRIYTEEPTDRKGAVMTAVLSVRPSCCYFLQGICTFGERCEHAHIKSTRCHFGHRCRVGHAAPLVEYCNITTGGASKGAGN